MMFKQFELFKLLGFIATVCQAVKITNIKVPDIYTIDISRNFSEKLLLDCNYELQRNETGFVLKWLFNDLPIYQWIQSQKPSALTVMKGLVDLSYSVSSETFFKYKAVLITNPSWNLTGEYTCHVQTFQSSDKKSAKLQVVVPENKFQLKHTKDNGFAKIICIVRSIFPEPNLQFELNENEMTDPISIKSQKKDNGLYDVEAEQKVQISKITCPSTFRCKLSLPGTNYTRRIEAVFYDVCSHDLENDSKGLKESIVRHLSQEKYFYQAHVDHLWKFQDLDDVISYIFIRNVFQKIME